MPTINSINNTNNNQPSTGKKIAYAAAGTVIGWEAEPFIRRGIQYPIRKLIKFPDSTLQNVELREYIDKALPKADSKFKFLDVNENNAEQIKNELRIKPRKDSTLTKIKNHILRRPNNSKEFFTEVLEGRNAGYNTKLNRVMCNVDKFGVAAFHELAHYKNYHSKNPITIALCTLRQFTYGGTLGIAAVTMLKNPPKEKDNKFDIDNFIKENCGTLTAAAILPLTLEESLANIKGYKLAKDVGVTGEKLAKVKTACQKSAALYWGGLVTWVLALKAASKVRDIIAAQGEK